MTKISKLSPTDFGSNIHHQHWCSQKNSPRINCSISANDDIFQNCFNFIINFARAVLSERILSRQATFKGMLSLKNLFSLLSYWFRNRLSVPRLHIIYRIWIHFHMTSVVVRSARQNWFCTTYWFRLQVYLFRWDKIEYRLLMNTSKTLKRLFKNPYIYPFQHYTYITLNYTVVP